MNKKTIFFIISIIILLSLPSVIHEDSLYYLDILSRIFIFALFAMSLDLIMGYGKMASMGHAIFFGIGAYGIAILSLHFGEFLGYNYFVILFFTLIVSAFVSLFIALIILKSSGIFLIMITLAFNQLFFFFFNSLYVYGGEDGLIIDEALRLPFVGEINEIIVYYLAIIIWFISYFIFKKILKSHFGLAFIALSNNELKARSLGFNTKIYKILFFIISSIFASIAGSLFALLNMFVSPTLMHWKQSIEVLIMVVLGGLGSLIGSLWGAGILLLSQEFLAPIFEWWHIILGLLIIFIIMFGKGGVHYLALSLFEKLKKK